MTLPRRHFLRSAALATAAAPLSALAHRVGRHAAHIPRIYMILYRGETPVEQGFRQYFTEHKLQAEFIVRDVQMDITRIPALLAEARALGADLIYTFGTPVTLAVAGKEGAVDPAVHETDIPVVFTTVASPRHTGVVRSLQSSRRNITGASHVIPVRDQLQAIRAWRRFHRIGVIYTPNEPNALLGMQELRAESAAFGYAVIAYPVPLDEQGLPQPAALPGLVAQLVRERAELLYLGPDNFLAVHGQAVTQAAIAAHLPTYSATEANLRQGRAMFGLVSGYASLGRLTGHKAAQILYHGKQPRAIPVETLGSFSYLVNMTVAQELGLRPPAAVLARAELLR